jgi:hypothetical protein
MLPYKQDSVLNAGSTIHVIVNVERVAYDIGLLYSHKICSMHIWTVQNYHVYEPFCFHLWYSLLHIYI